MKKLLLLVMVIGLVASCGKSDEGAETAENTATTGEEMPESRPGIPDKGTSGYETAAAAVIRPSFDMEGKETSKEVTPGEMFDLYILAEYNDAFSMTGAEYKLIVPEGVTVLGTTYMDSINVTLGKYETDLLMAFHCLPGPRNWITKYICEVEDSFAGGKFETLPGDNLGFMGFVMCDDLKTEIRAAGGAVELGRK
jgi:hypothetical protein